MFDPALLETARLQQLLINTAPNKKISDEQFAEKQLQIMKQFEALEFVSDMDELLFTLLDLYDETKIFLEEHLILFLKNKERTLAEIAKEEVYNGIRCVLQKTVATISEQQLSVNFLDNRDTILQVQDKIQQFGRLLDDDSVAAMGIDIEMDCSRDHELALEFARQNRFGN